jgi:hypothetical protein
MHPSTRNLFLALILSSVTVAYGQTPSAPQTPQTKPAAHPEGRSAGGEVGSGAGDIGKGTAQAGGNVAKGAGNLVTLHPIGAGKDLGKGGKDLGVGAAKGTGKIAKGTGRGIGHLFHHSHKDTTPEAPE